MRSFLRAAACALLALAAPARASDLAAMHKPEIEALQKRLTDAGCYTGAIDGQASPATAEAVKVCPDQDPMLRIETGMHVAPILHVGVDAACRLLATGSIDKTVRLWALPEGRLIRTVRLPIDVHEGGKVNTVALSPDGRMLAVGGYDAAYHNDPDKGMGLYLVDLNTNGVRRIGALNNTINEIAFSPDGMRVAVGLFNYGLHVFDTITGRELMADRSYISYSHDSDTSGLAFASDGSLFTTSNDGFLRRYGPDLKLKVKVKAIGGKKPESISLSPDGRRIAIGFDDTAGVSILDAVTLKLLARGDTVDVKSGNFSRVAWTAGGALLAGGTAGSPFFLRRFDSAGRRLGLDAPAANETIFDLDRCGAGAAFSAADTRFGLTDADGAVRVLQTPIMADMSAKLGNAFTISDDASVVRFGLQTGEARPVRVDLGSGTLTDAPDPSGDLHPARIEGLPVTDWQNSDAPRFKGKPFPLFSRDVSGMSRSLAIAPDRSGFALGSNFLVQSFDDKDDERWRTSVPGIVYGVNLSADGKVVVAATFDGTVHWYRWSDGQELLALFVNAQDKRWVAWTPTGYYMASPGGEDMIGWHLNRGWEQEADFFPASRFRDKFNRPDVVRLVLKTLDEGEAVKQANAAAHKREDAKPLIERLPPVVTILSPSEGASVAPGAVEVHYRLRLPSGRKVERVEVFVDGAKIEARGLGRVEAPGADEGSVTLPMPPHDTVVGIIAYADGLASDAARVTLKGAAPVQAPKEDDALKPSLYALLVGVSHYGNKDFDLGYPAADAAGLAQTLKSQEGRLYRHVEVKLLTDGEASAAGMKDGLLWLQKQTTTHDLAIVFAAGHGMTDAKGRFWFLTHEADPSRLLSTAVSQGDITDVLYDLPGKKLLLLDACHSGAALSTGARGLERTDVSAAVNDFAQAEGGVVAYAASTGKEFSLERSEWGHGAFTKALIEGLGEGKADLTHKGVVTTATLDFFLAERVKELTGGAQHPIMTRPKTVPDFPVAVVP